MKYEITKEQVLELVRIGTDVTKRYLKEVFPEAFKLELQVGKWYKYSDSPIHLLFATRVLEKSIEGYGVDRFGWRTKGTAWVSKDLVEATFEEVGSILIKEARRRGYKNGVTCAFGSEGEFERKLTGDDFVWDGYKLCIKTSSPAISDVIFLNGVWAPILVEEVKKLTMDKAVRILSKKYGKQVIIK